MFATVVGSVEGRSWPGGAVKEELGRALCVLDHGAQQRALLQHASTGSAITMRHSCTRFI